MAALKEPVKIFIVQSLACFETPQQVADAVQQRFGIEIDRRQCEGYDPTKFSGRNLSKKLTELFHQTREDFRKNIFDIPIANQAYRLKEIQGMYNDSGKNKRIKQNLLKLAYQETDARTTKQEITGADGGPIQNENTTYVTATKEQVRQVWDELESKY